MREVHQTKQLLFFHLFQHMVLIDLPRASILMFEHLIQNHLSKVINKMYSYIRKIIN